MIQNVIKEVLKEQGRTQSFLCQKLGKSPNTISSWCKNESQPTLIDAKRIASLLDVKLDELVKP